ncbi:DNA polymerase III catalytic subunit, DnaE type [Hathewaya proteolytica DSM 3090]|uniref:DNA polymerase III subunit alpha n=1 Tax=Hathewaya proteolytica DSM 3090 TaxID=1121331 RepID=A0A1M6NGW3_9CLOT|nr:DNA polymerase III subunit alpha [Hathewaya proteolytica]SHJ94945.1 DNA polymerase III catalytic subunit, DnaE type [Hathewaya proteolytica DSM 3090]
MGEFVHLHTHTGYSLLDGAGKIPDIIKRTKELGMDAIAITDHGSMFGCVEFYKEAKKEGIKPIIGCEIYVATKSMYIKNPDSDNETCHLVLLVKNETGYENLMKIVSKASIDGFYYKPRVDHEYLQAHSEGLIATSACQGGEVQKYLLRGLHDKAKSAALFYKSIFKDSFYLELQYHGTPEDLKLNEELVKLSKETHIPLVCTNDIHYVNKDDWYAHDVLICIQTGKTVDDENRMQYSARDFYIKSPEEMKKNFAYAPEAIENTVKIAEQCNFDYEFHKSKLPNFPLPESTNHAEYLEERCYEGLVMRYDVFGELRNKDISPKQVRKFAEENEEARMYTERMDYELNVITTMGYVDYFLIVWDFIRFARENGIMTGPGRGSGAASIVAYSLEITKIDPIKYNLIFERFLNPERISMPDIDSDFCYERRQEVIDYVVEKYGKDNVSQIVTFGTMAARVCIRDVGRAMNYSYGEVDKIAKMVPAMLNITIDKALEINPELKEAYDGDERVKNLIDIAKRLEGLPRHTSTHAAGVVIASKPLVNYVPLLKNEEAIVAQFDMNTLEELGLLKMDFLGLRTLTVIRDTVNIIKETKGIDVDMDKIDFEDKNVYNMIGEGDTVGVFQLESSGMTSFMKDLKPDSLEDIIAGISLYRPGPMAEIPRYVQNKRDPQHIEYITPELEPILNVTYGCTIYQEQVMQVVRDLAGYSMGRSDLVRRAMSKKKHKVMEEERHNFIHGIVDENGKVEVEGCLRRGISEDVANAIYDSLMDFASYGFNKAHAAAYAIVAYETAYLIRYYPVEYTAAILNSVMGNSEKVSFYIRYAESAGIQVLTPDINKSYAKFTVENGCIRFGLASVKNVGINVINEIVKSRNEKGDFIDFLDFCNKIDGNYINKRVVESLIKVGAFDRFQIHRSQLLMVYEKILDGIITSKRKNIEGQISLFDSPSEEMASVSFEYPKINEFEKKYLLAMEKEMSGIYLSGHPLDEYEETLNVLHVTPLSNIVSREEQLDEEDNLESVVMNKKVNLADGETVVIAGLISTVKRLTTKKNDFMAFINVEDLEESVECIVFPKILSQFNNLIEEDNLVVIRGRISYKDEETKILCEHIEQLYKIGDEKIYALLEDEPEVRKITDLIKKNIDKFKGRTPVYLCTKDRKTFLIDREYWVNGEMEVLKFLKEHCGEENVKVITQHG